MGKGPPLFFTSPEPEWGRRLSLPSLAGMEASWQCSACLEVRIFFPLLPDFLRAVLFMLTMFLSISLLCTERRARAVTFRNKYGIFHGPNLALTFFTLPSSALAQKKEMKKNGGRRREREEGAERVFFLLFLKTEEEEERSRGTPSQESGLRDSPNMKPFFDWKYPPILSYGIYSRFNIVDQHHSIWSIYRTKQWGPFPPQPPCWVGMGRGRKGGKKKKEERGGGERGKKAMPLSLACLSVCRRGESECVDKKGKNHIRSPALPTCFLFG